MKKLIISGVFCSVLLLGGFQVASAEETTTTTSNTEMLAKIQDLMKLIADLQAKLTAARGEIKELMSDLSVGDENEDVKKIQELLASDPTLFKVKPTGYYGPLTEEAIKKFQERYGLPVTGIVDEATREVMKELRKERKEGHVPPGLVKSDEVKARIKARLEDKWGDCIWGEKFRASDCQKGHDDDEDDDMEDDSDDDDSVDATRADALAAIEDANEAIDALIDEIDQMEEDDADAGDIEDAEDNLMDAKKKLSDARKALYRGNYDEAVDKAEDAVEEASGDDGDDSDDDDDEDDDMDDDSDDDDDDSDNDDDE